MPTPSPLVRFFGVAILSAALLAGCESKVSKDSYQQIQIGMTMHEVERLLGGSGTEDSAPPGLEISGAGAASTKDAPKDKIYTWKSDDITIIVTFQNGKVVSKSSK